MYQLTDEMADTFVKNLKNNTIQYHQFYNTDISAEENNLLLFNQLYKENTEMKRLNKTYYDIEVINDQDEFPDPEKHKFPVNSIATYNNIKNESVIFCILKNTNIVDEHEIYDGIITLYNKLIVDNDKYEVPNMKIRLLKFNTEEEMLAAFWEYLKE